MAKGAPRPNATTFLVHFDGFKLGSIGEVHKTPSAAGRRLEFHVVIFAQGVEASKEVSLLCGQGTQPHVWSLHRREATVHSWVLTIKFPIDLHGHASCFGLGNLFQSFRVVRRNHSHHGRVVLTQKLQGLVGVVEVSDGPAFLFGKVF